MSDGRRPPLRFACLADHRESAGRLFEDLATDPVAARFHPHPLTRMQAMTMKWKNDVYALCLNPFNDALGYGLLRGWDAGYEVPSLGIAIAKRARGHGIARIFMHYLHVCAYFRNAKEIRLRVYPDNVGAIKLYESLGYVLKDVDEDQLVGTLDLTSARTP